MHYAGWLMSVRILERIFNFNICGKAKSINGADFDASA
jgi:hypothetical protein